MLISLAITKPHFFQHGRIAHGINLKLKLESKSYLDGFWHD